MNKRINAVCGLILAAGFLFQAAEARADVAIGVGIEGYMPAANMRGAEARAAQLEKLSNTVDSLAVARDTEKTEVLLAAVYSGTGNGGAAPVVYRDAVSAPAVQLARALPLEVKRSAAVDLGEAAGAAVEKKDSAGDGKDGKDGKEDAAPAEKPTHVNSFGSGAKTPCSANAFCGLLFLFLLLLCLL